MAAPSKTGLPESLKGATIPTHIAVIMDGNGRWAKSRGLADRIFGHHTGAEVAREITRECGRIGVKRLTLYAFSAENWKRPEREVAALMDLLKKYLLNERTEIMGNNIRFAAIGRIEALPADVRRELDGMIAISRNNTGMVLCLALNYGGRQEIADAARSIARDVKGGKLDPEKIDEAAIAGRLYDPAAADPELLIRTGGDQRISNFLLWQISYAELYVTPKLWPDFSNADLHEAILDFSKRERRFGGL